MERTSKTEDRTGRVELADRLEARKQEIVDRWLRQVSADARAADVPRTALANGIGEYLTRLAELLRGAKSIAGAGAAAWNDVARDHAITRVQLGFDVKQLGHELIVLRRVITDVLLEEGLLHDVSQLARLTDLIEAAMNASVMSYVQHRDNLSRRAEAEHIGFLTHELRNPLGAIAMAAEQLRMGPPPQNHERIHQVLDRNIDRLQKMINDVLLNERLEVGEVESHPVDLTVGDLLGDIVDVQQNVARSKGIELRVSFDPELHVYVDRKLTTSAIENLIDNAIKFTDAGEVTVEVEDRGGEIAVHVRDHCRGISSEELRVIFEPFRRAHSGKPGTGLGLAIARRAVEAQGGRIEAESSGEGSCHFWVTLPRTHH